MSRTKGKKQRDVYDFYRTPEWCVYRLLEKLSFPLGNNWLEPTAGDGAIIKAVINYNNKNNIKNPIFHAVELQEQFKKDLEPLATHITIGNFNTCNLIKNNNNKKFDFCIGNPPYRDALSIIKEALLQAENVCMLLRINFLSSEERAEWMSNNPPQIFVLPNRPKYKNGKSDACEYAWFLWGKNSTGKVSILNTTPKHERKGC